MSVHMVRIILTVCKGIGCWKQATYSVWDDKEHFFTYSGTVATPVCT